MEDSGFDKWDSNIVKRWLTTGDKFKPHGWRFTCRNRNEATKTQGMRKICLMNVKFCKVTWLERETLIAVQHFIQTVLM